MSVEQHVQAIRTAQAQLITDGHEKIARDLDAVPAEVRALPDRDRVNEIIEQTCKRDNYGKHLVPDDPMILVRALFGQEGQR